VHALLDRVLGRSLNTQLSLNLEIVDDVEDRFHAPVLDHLSDALRG
jgi:hypothetical protein